MNQSSKKLNPKAIIGNILFFFITFVVTQYLVKSESGQSMTDIPLRVWFLQIIMAIIGGVVFTWILSRSKKQ